jgi:nucleotide-binding universal stress UspA family protein
MSVETLVREIPLGAGVDTTIIETAQELGAHAIAMSTHGHSAGRHVVMGSVAMLLLGRSPLPLLLARAV